MDQRRAKRSLIRLLAAALALAVLGGCGASEETIPPLTGSVLSAATPTAGISTCASCHSEKTTAWLTSRHANISSGGSLYSAGSPTIGEMGDALCIPCHDPLGDSNNLTAGVTGNTARPVVGCEACHGPGSLHVNAGGAGPISLVSNTTGTVISGATPTVLSGQFVMCTSCHELLDMTTGDVRSDPTHSVSPPDPAGLQHVITDTHFATSGAWLSTNGGDDYAAITGYAMDFSKENVCTTCHNPHGTAEINREWASSGHADSSADGPWGHYNWSCDGTDETMCGKSGPNINNRKACQRCHTNDGFIAFADALKAGNTTLANSISAGTANPAPVVYSTGTNTGSFKPQMLLCSGCHTDNSGNLRNPGSYQALYGNGSVTHQYSDLVGSNVCLPCHTGRNSGEYVKLLNSGFDAMKFSVVDTHYLAAGATMFRSGGYEYSGRNYANPSAYKHDKIGTSALAIDGGANGPCVGCHMYRTGASANHTFSVVGKTGLGEITGITSDVCFNMTCHAGSNSMLTEIAEAEREEFEAALVAFAEALVSGGFPPYGYTVPGDLSSITYPYFGTFANQQMVNWLTQSPLDADTTGNMTGKNNMGAAVNFSLLHHEPGAYVHNSKYAKRLIYDSIDWIDDNEMNFSAGNFLEGLGDLNAMKYLLNGGQKTGNSAERP